MKGILAEPGAEPVVTTLPDSLWAIENRLGTRSEMIVLPRTPAVLVYGIMQRPEPYLSRTAYLRPHPLLRLEGNNIQPMSKDVQAEMLNRLKDTEVRV